MSTPPKDLYSGNPSPALTESDDFERRTWRYFAGYPYGELLAETVKAHLEIRRLHGLITELRTPAKDRADVCQGAVGTADEAQHLDDMAVINFAAQMRKRMTEKRNQGYHGWDNVFDCPTSHLIERMTTALLKGAMVDVANYAMMLDARGVDKLACGSLLMREMHERLEDAGMVQTPKPYNGKCRVCRGMGQVVRGLHPATVCEACGGSGKSQESFGEHNNSNHTFPCPDCKGTGKHPQPPTER